jgi:HK97 family phage prohead protease
MLAIAGLAVGLLHGSRDNGATMSETEDQGKADEKKDERLYVPYEVKSDVTAKGIFEGYGSVFGNLDLGNDIVEKGAFTKTIEQHAKDGTMPNMFFAHYRDEPIGEFLEIAEDRKGLYVKGQIWVDQGIPKAQQAYLMLKAKGLRGLSIGYKTQLAEYDNKKGIRRLKQLDLKETSPTPFPMNEKALPTSVKSFQSFASLSIREAEQFLRDVGLSHTEAKALLSRGFDGLRPRDEVSDNLLKSSLKKLTDTLKGT